MRHECKRLAVFIALVLFLMTCAVAGAAETQPPGKSVSSESAVQEQLHKARMSFLKKDFHDAAAEIRAASAFLKDESTEAAGVAKQDLTSSSQELAGLADRVEKRAVTSENELDQGFARAEHALARYYQARASESWARKEASQAGRYLKAAALQLESALASSGSGMEEKGKKAVRDAREIGEKMEKGVTVAASDVDKSLDAVKKEIDDAARKIPFPRLTEATVIQVAERPKGAVDLSTAIVRVANQRMPAVVYIEVTESRMVENPLLPFENDPFFRRFFGMPKMPRKFKQERKGLGSGMIIDSHGHILTNNHVAGSAAKMQVTLADGSQYPAKLVGGDAKTDLAVIRIDALGPLPHVIFGDSDTAEVGEWVVAIGAPRALEKSVTQGIISAKHRTGISDPNSYQDFLQTDAPINPGNSGGPLLNLYGQVIGVNAAIATESGGFEGIGFTIPSRMAVYVASALMTHGKVERGWLGVSIRNLTPELAKAAHVETLTGSLIVEVVKEGPAEKAGLKKNDVVITYGDEEIPDSATLRNDVAQTPVGREVKLTILREGKKEHVTVTVGNLAEATNVLAAVVKERLGAEVRLPTPKEVEQYGLNENQGVVIARLDPKGPLAAAGFEVEDMILAIEGQPVEGMDSFIDLVSVLPVGKKVSLTALDHRTGNRGNIFVVTR
jgi:serine protease Do